MKPGNAAPQGILFDLGNTLLREEHFDIEVGTARVLEFARNPRGLSPRDVCSLVADLEQDLRRRRVRGRLRFTSKGGSLVSISNAPIALPLCALLAGTSLATSCASEGQGPEPDPYGPESNQQAMEEEDEQDVWNDINR